MDNLELLEEDDRDKRTIKAEWLRLSQAETRLWISVIFEALNDLTDNDATIREEAQGFIEGKTGSLQNICQSIGLNSKAIISMYQKLGPAEMKKRFITVLRKKTL